MSTENSDTEQPTPSPSPSPGTGIDFVFGRRRRRRRSTSTTTTTTTTSSSAKTIGSYNLGTYSNITYNGSTVRQIQLNGKTIWNQPALDVSLAYSSITPMDSYGKLDFRLWKYLKWYNKSNSHLSVGNSNGHVICIVYAPNGKVGGFSNGMPIQDLKLKWTIKNTAGSRTHCWMTGKREGYFKSQRGKEGNNYASCGRYVNHCRHPLTGWVPFDARFSGATGGKKTPSESTYWFSSFRLHDGNSYNKITIQVYPGEHKWFSNETQDKLYIKT